MELSLKSRERRVGFALTVPALLAFAVMILLPFVQSFRLALPPFGGTPWFSWC